MSTSPADEILGQLDLNQLAKQLGADKGSVETAVRAVVPSLIGGLEHNANDPKKEPGVATALAQHGTSNLLDGGQVSIDQVDTADGAKIVKHIFGSQSGKLATAIGTQTGTKKSLVQELLPILAPIVLAYVAKQIGSGLQQPTSDGGSVLGAVLGSVLSGGLGSMLGGGQQAPAQNTFNVPGNSGGMSVDVGQSNASPSAGDIVDSVLGSIFKK